MRHSQTVPIVLAVLMISVGLGAQHSPMPAGMTHEEHSKQMERESALKQRGTEAMEFDQDATAHRFLLTSDGGAIEVAVRDDGDESTRLAVRRHLREIAQQFADGVFDKPFATHAEVPPGVATMQLLRASITYTYEDSAQGGRIRITTARAAALTAIHDFLRYQIVEHGTADRLLAAPNEKGQTWECCE